MSRFGALAAKLEKPVSQPGPAKAPEQSPVPEGRRSGRAGKKLIGGWFSADLNRQLHYLALDENTTLQALLGESLDMLLRARGKHSFGER
jgi:hypothetical protein